MRKIIRPTVNVDRVLDDCIENMLDSSLKTEIIESKNYFINAEIEFETKILNNELYTIAKNVTISDSLNSEKLIGIYENRLLNKKNNGRIHYDTIFMSAPNGKCPYCSQRIVKTLDHYLPKSIYPLYSITPINLVPSCSDCNKDKRISSPSNSEEESLHPYYDDIENENWLKVKLHNVKPLTLEYFVLPQIAWSELLNKRVEFHFKAYDLNTLFCIHALEEFENIKSQLENLFVIKGKEELKDHLFDCYKSRENANKNSWQTAFYEGLFTNESFLNGEFI